MALPRFLALNYVSNRWPWAFAPLFRAGSGYRIATGTAWGRMLASPRRITWEKQFLQERWRRERPGAAATTPFGCCLETIEKALQQRNVSRNMRCCPGLAMPEAACRMRGSKRDCSGFKMKILYVADLHYSLKQFDWLLANAGPYDIAAIGGDLLDVGGVLDPDVQIVVIERYLKRLRCKTCLLVVSGNHDADARNPAGEWFAKWLIRARGDGLFVDGDEVILPEATVTLCPWWDGPVSRAELEQFLSQAASRVTGKWIWIHHAPPDQSPVSWTGRKFAGDKYLVEWIGRFGPDLVLCGHIHNAPFYPDGSWIDRIGKTWVFNPGRQIGACPTSIVFDLDAMTAEWSSVYGESLKRLAIDAGEVSGGALAAAGS